MNNLLASGSLDPSFGTGGVAVLPGAGESSWATCVSVIAGGGVYIGLRQGRNYAIAQLTVDGLLEPSFGVDGWVADSYYHGSVEPLNSRCDVLEIIQTKEHLVIVGEVYLYLPPGKVFLYPCMARYHKDGTLDRTFADNGHKIFDQVLQEKITPTGLNARCLDPQGPVAAGVGAVAHRLSRLGDRLYAVINGAIQFGGQLHQAAGVLAFDLEGEVDTLFGEDGLAIIKHATFETQLFNGYVDQEGLYFTGIVAPADYAFLEGVAVKLTLTGQYDSQFGGGFTVLGHGITPLGMFSLPHNALVVVGHGIDKEGRGNGLQLGLHKTTGLPDAAFNHGRPLWTDIGGVPVILQVGLAGVGAYWVAGQRKAPGVRGQLALGKFFDDGTADVAFGEQGWTLTPDNQMTDCAAFYHTLVVDGQGRVVIAGFLTGDPTLPVVARVLP